MKRFLELLGGTRVTLLQLALVSAASAVVSAVIVVGALGETGPERAVIAALRTSQVIHASGSASARVAPVSTVTSAAAHPSSAPAPATPVSSGPPANAATSAAVASTSSANDSSGSGTSSSDGSGSSGTGSGASNSVGSGGATGGGARGATVSGASGPTSKIKHVFVIVLSTPSYQAAFGHGSTARYLDSTLRLKGELLSGYHSLGVTPTPDLLAMVSGQAPNSETKQGCPKYTEYPSSAGPAKDGLVPGAGCVYPNTALTIGDQLDGANLPWRGYIEGMTSACQHPNSGAVSDPGTGGYATNHNPFVYFHSLLDLGDCQSDDLPLGRLPSALQSAKRTPSYTFISPDLCDFGAAVPCPGPAAQTGGITTADGFLRRTVPDILRSPAYRAAGALIIAFTAAPSAANPGTPRAGQPTSGQSATGQSDGASSRGGPVRTGALVLSRHTKPDSTDAQSYNPYSVLRTVEDIFGQTPLAKANTAKGFDSKVFKH